MNLAERVTVCMPVMNASKAINASLEALAMQEIPRLKVLIYDNGSVDGTPEMIKKQIENKWWRYIDMELSETTERTGGKTVNIPFMRHKLLGMVKTELVFFLDADVIIPPRSLEQLVKEFDESKGVGMMGLRYEPLHDHVTMGATVMRSDIGRKIEWKWTGERCDCMTCIKQLQDMGLDSLYYRHTQARHLKIM